jgi:hypothetical protein
VRRHIARQRQSGQGTVEYLVVSAALVTGLFFIDVDGHSLAATLADMVRLFFRNLTYFISLP